MDVCNLINIHSRQELYLWYQDNHNSCREFWIRVNRSRTPVEGVIGYVDAVEVALCFGWIDSTIKKIDDGKPVQRFTPRRKGSHWTDLNRERCRKLAELGLMTPSGLAAAERRTIPHSMGKHE